MKYDSDILTLIYSMNENQRIDFSILINNMKNDLDKNLLKFGSNFTCDDILLRTIEITKHENIRKLKEVAAKNGETTILKDNWGVHITHCCSIHGCKYGDADCPVELGLVKQEFPCEFCRDE